MMRTRQGDLALLDHPVAQELLASTFPARLAYNWRDGTPRVVPINFHWNGKEIVLGTPTGSPKMRVLQDQARVTLTIDSDRMPYHVLTIRGTIRTDVTEGIAPEYALACHRILGHEGGEAWLEQLRPLTPKMARIFITPDWVGVLDFETRLPSAVEQAIEQLESTPGEVISS